MPPEFVSQRIADVFNEAWSPGLAAIDGVDLTFIHTELRRRAPGNVVEVGCCTGLSTALLALMLDEIGPASITSIDLMERVYFDETKPVGYLVEELAAHTDTTLHLLTGHTAAVLPSRFGPDEVDFCLVDASHQHPWPTIDTLCVLPTMRVGGMVAHHDLQLYRSDRNNVGVGPKLLFDQIDEDQRITVPSVLGTEFDRRLRGRHITDNIFGFRREQDLQRQGRQLARALYLPWSTVSPISSDLVELLRELLSTHYPDQVLHAFDTGFKRKRIEDARPSR